RGTLESLRVGGPPRIRGGRGSLPCGRAWQAGGKQAPVRSHVRDIPVPLAGGFFSSMLVHCAGTNRALAYRTFGRSRERYARAASDVTVDECGELRLRQRPDLGRLDVAVFEQHQGGDPADTVLRWCLGIVVDVELGDADAITVAL